MPLSDYKPLTPLQRRNRKISIQKVLQRRFRFCRQLREGAFHHQNVVYTAIKRTFFWKSVLDGKMTFKDFLGL